jgi:hypothetical protein
VRAAENRAKSGLRPRCGSSIAHFRDPEVEDLGDLLVAVSHQVHVVGLQVAMHDPRRVRFFHGACHVRHDAQRFFRRQSTKACETRTQ